MWRDWTKGTLWALCASCLTLNVSLGVFRNNVDICRFFVRATVVMQVLLLRNKYKKFATALWCFAKEASSIANCKLRQQH